MIYGISDLHLDSSGDKSMEIFGESWSNYQNRIKINWNRTIGEEDLVLVPGDISWALKFEEAVVDLQRIDNLPGKKILMKGNHDYWWKSLSKLNSLELESIEFLQNNSFFYEGINIGGTRGWNPRDSILFDEKDESIFRRELIRLDLSLKSIDNNMPIIVMLHYPPFNRDGSPNEFVNMMKNYNVKKCVYGHLHSEGLIGVQEGLIDGIEFYCLSADYLEFKPIIIL